MTTFDRPYATFYWSAIVNIASSCTTFELFDVDLEILVVRHSRSLKLVPFTSLSAVFYSDFYSNFGSILSHFRDKVRYGPKVAIFAYPLAFYGLTRGSQSEYCHTVWYGKLGLSLGRHRCVQNVVNILEFGLPRLQPII